MRTGLPKAVFRSSLSVLALAALAAAGAAGGFAYQDPVPVAPPRLVVLIAVDQMIPEQLDRLGPYLNGGLGRFAHQGRVFRAANLGHSRTETGPGHASLATGYHPDKHGIVGNNFYDRQLGRSVYCVEDRDARPVIDDGEAKGMSRSPRHLLVPALGDYLRDAHPGTRVVSISMKDRAAVGLGGQRPDFALWWDTVRGGFSSSSWYGEALPDWVKTWNAGWLGRTSGFVWEPRFPTGPPGSGTAADDRAWEGMLVERRTLPLVLPEFSEESDVRIFAGFAYKTPLGDQFITELAAQAVGKLELGGDDIPDLLCLSYSACDVVGHRNGPYSVEVTDLMLRLDAELGGLFELLDERVGKERWIACLSSDHGVAELPEALAARQIPSVRVVNRSGAAGNAIVQHVAAGLQKQYESDFGLIFTGAGLVLDGSAVEAAGLALEDVRAAAARLAMERDEIAQAFTLDSLLAPDAGDEPLRLLASRSVTADRGPDVFLQVAPWYVWTYETGTTHGSPYPYDRRIPLVFLGPSFEPGTSYEQVESIDVVPTLLHALGMAIPAGLDGSRLPSK